MSKYGKRAPKREFLLDTGIIRSLSGPEEKFLLEAGRHSLFTASFISPFEMLSGIPTLRARDFQREYQRRRAGLKKYNRVVSPEQTYWDDAEQILGNAFGVPRRGTNKLGLLLLIRACIERDTLEQLELDIARKKAGGSPIWSLEVLRREDRSRRNSYLSTLRFVQRINQAAGLEAPDAEAIKTQLLCLWARAVGVLDIPDESFNTIPMEEMKRIEGEVWQHYDGSLGLYVETYIAYWKQLRTGQRSLSEKGGNDPLDITLFCHMRSNDANQCLVSDDRGILRIGQEIAPSRFLDKAAFLREVR